jgi:hypothetical protein
MMVKGKRDQEDGRIGGLRGQIADLAFDQRIFSLWTGSSVLGTIEQEILAEGEEVWIIVWTRHQVSLVILQYR